MAAQARRLLWLVFWLLPASAAAQSLLDFYRSAIETNPNLRAREHAIEQSRGQEDQAGSVLKPQIFVVGNHNWNNYAKWAYVGPDGLNAKPGPDHNTVAFNNATGTYAINSWGNWANLGPQYISPLKFETYSTNSFQIYDVNGNFGTPPRAARSTVQTHLLEVSA